MSGTVPESGESIAAMGDAAGGKARSGTRLLAGTLAVLAVFAGLFWLLSEGSLLVESAPAGAEVLVDGRLLGTTPYTLRTRLTTAGTLEIRMPGYEPQRLPFSLAPRQQGTLSVTLMSAAARTGQLEVVSQPSGSQAFLDGRAIGTTPLTVENLEPGEHSLRLVLANYRELTRQVAITAGQRTTVEGQLVGLPGSIAISSTPEGATVYLDEKEQGQTPAVLAEVAAGEHAVRLAKDGFQEWLQTVRLEPNGKIDLAAQLRTLLAPAVVSARPLAMSIDNHAAARPQSGLSRAAIVYEAITEGGITRFLGIFMSSSADAIGPVRSARHYFVYWADEYDAIFAHCGGYPEAYQAVAATGIAELDDLQGSPGFWRSAARAAPHNLYTSAESLRAAAAAKGFKSDLGSYGGLTFADGNSLVEGTPAGRITVAYPYGYKVQWQYDPAANEYRRFTNGVPHVDANDGEQLRAGNVVVLTMKNWFIGRDDQQDMQQTGSGRALIFRDGRLIEGKWTREALDKPTHLQTDSGEQVALKPGGATWIQVIPNDESAAYD